MNLTLHIGTAQTQVSPIQSWFARNREALAAQGVMYPRTLGRVNHRDLAIYAGDPGKRDRAMEQRGIRSAKDHKAWSAALEKAFGEEVAAHKAAKHWVISSELLHSRVTSQSMARKVKAFLKPHFKKITVVIHLRPQVDMLVAGMGQRTRNGQTVTPDVLTRKSVSESNPYFNYSQIVSRWEVIFGKPNVAVLPYRRGENLITHVSALAGLNRDALSVFEPAPEVLDWRVTGLANMLAGGVKDIGGMRAALDLDHQITTDPLQIGLTMAQDIQGRFAKTNARLIARRDDLQDDDLTPDWDAYDAAPNVYRLEEDTSLGEPLLHVLTQHRQALRLADARALLAEGALALAQGHRDSAQEALDQARKALAIPSPHPEHKDLLEALIPRADALEQALGKAAPDGG